MNNRLSMTGNMFAHGHTNTAAICVRHADSLLLRPVWGRGLRVGRAARPRRICQEEKKTGRREEKSQTQLVLNEDSDSSVSTQTDATCDL